MPGLVGLRYTNGFCEEAMLVVMQSRAAADEISAIGDRVEAMGRAARS